MESTEVISNIPVAIQEYAKHLNLELERSSSPENSPSTLKRHVNRISNTQRKSDDLVTIKNTDDYNNYLVKKQIADDPEKLQALMLSGQSESVEQQHKLYARASSLKTVGYGSIEKSPINNNII